jgi:hypothetical protein
VHSLERRISRKTFELLFWGMHTLEDVHDSREVRITLGRCAVIGDRMRQ